MRSVLLIGANGQLGSDLRKEAPSAHGVTSVTRQDLDITDHGRVAAMLRDLRPEVIVNTAAFINVEVAEVEVDAAFAVNAVAVRNLAIEADAIGATLVHISTDY